MRASGTLPPTAWALLARASTSTSSATWSKAMAGISPTDTRPARALVARATSCPPLRVWVRRRCLRTTMNTVPPTAVAMTAHTTPLMPHTNPTATIPAGTTDQAGGRRPSCRLMGGGTTIHTATPMRAAAATIIMGPPPSPAARTISRHPHRGSLHHPRPIARLAAQLLDRRRQ